MWKYDTLFFFFWQMESRRLMGQGFASSAEPILALFFMSRQSKWTVVSLSFFGISPVCRPGWRRFYRRAIIFQERGCVDDVGFWLLCSACEQDAAEAERSRTPSRRR
ncbi:hypothetical protein LJR034_004168 [Caballeronia sp. LjRoot34]|jgi:hypothetical protein|uniref:hypothetical protein n=1 Tax=Caballeronia sp. LjRoot34 TaxID=3342325 RepID=UPI003ECE0C23